MKKQSWLTAAAMGLVFVVISCAYGLGGEMAVMDIKIETNRMTNTEQTLILGQIKDSLHELDKSIAKHTLLLEVL